MTAKNAVNVVHEREKNHKPVYTPDINVRWQRVIHIFRNNLRLTTVHANTYPLEYAASLMRLTICYSSKLEIGQNRSTVSLKPVYRLKYR